MLPVCPCVVSFSKFHEPDTHDVLRTSSRGCYADATTKLLPWHLNLYEDASSRVFAMLSFRGGIKRRKNRVVDLRYDGIGHSREAAVPGNKHGSPGWPSMQRPASSPDKTSGPIDRSRHAARYSSDQLRRCCRHLIYCRQLPPSSVSAGDVPVRASAIRRTTPYYRQPLHAVSRLDILTSASVLIGT